MRSPFPSNVCVQGNKERLVSYFSNLKASVPDVTFTTLVRTESNAV